MKPFKIRYGKAHWVETIKTGRSRFQTFTLDIPEVLRSRVLRLEARPILNHDKPRRPRKTAVQKGGA